MFCGCSTTIDTLMSIKTSLCWTVKSLWTWDKRIIQSSGKLFCLLCKYVLVNKSLWTEYCSINYFLLLRFVCLWRLCVNSQWCYFRDNIKRRWVCENLEYYRLMASERSAITRNDFFMSSARTSFSTRFLFSTTTSFAS